MISLNPLEKKHFELFEKWWNNLETRHLTSQNYDLISKEEIEKILNDRILSKNYYSFIIYHDDNPIGDIFLSKSNRQKYFELFVSIGEKEHLNKGFGTEAIDLLLKRFFEKFPFESIIQLEVNIDNGRAISCYKKVGFKKIRLKHHKDHCDTILMRYIKKTAN